MNERPLLSLPHYEGLLENKAVDRQKFLTTAEMLEQTGLFIQGYVASVDDGTAPKRMFFLDKGARPIRIMFERTMQRSYPSLPLPELLHINIGREISGDSIPFRGDPEIIKSEYGVESPEHIQVVDDYAKTYATLNLALKSLQKAYPDTRISSKVVYSKIPNWQGRPEYEGVVEYSLHDYYLLTLQELNRRRGTSFSSFGQFIRSDEKRQDKSLSYQFYSILSELKGTIPTIKGPAEFQLPWEEELERVIEEIQKTIDKY